MIPLCRFSATLLVLTVCLGCGESKGPGDNDSQLPPVEDVPAPPVDTDPSDTVLDTTVVDDTGESDGTEPEDVPSPDIPFDVPPPNDADPGMDVPPDSSNGDVAADINLEDTTTPTDVPTADTSPDVPLTDTGVVTDTIEDTSPPMPSLWLLSIDNGSKQLQRVDVDTGIGTNLCKLKPASGIGSVTASYPSLTFSRNNVLYASRSGASLDVIDPCTCEVTSVGSYGGFSGVNGITSNQATDLFGVSSTSDDLIGIDTSNGLGSVIGDGLQVDFGTGGATWSDFGKTLYAINGNDESLYTIHPITGVATLVVALSKPFGTVGIELHPYNGVIYACTDFNPLREIDPLTGIVTEKPNPMGQVSSCTNLAAPWKPVACLDP